MESLTPTEQQQFQQILEKRQMKDFITMYSNLVQKCFDDCINDFTSKAVSAKETTCVNNCATKFMKASERLGMRFQEANANMMQGAAPGR